MALDYKAIGLADLGKPQGYLDRQVGGWIQRYHGSQTHNLPEVEKISVWLNECRPHEASYSLIHNGLQVRTISCLIQSISPGLSACSIGRCAPSVIHSQTSAQPWRTGSTRKIPKSYSASAGGLQNIAWHSDAGGTCRPLRYRLLEATVSNIVFYRVLALFKVAVIIQQIYYRYHQGLTKDIRFASLQE